MSQMSTQRVLESADFKPHGYQGWTYSQHRELHLIVNEARTHKKPKDHLTECGIFLYFIPTTAFWPDQIEVWLSVLSRKVLKRGIFNSKEEPRDSTMSFIEQYTKKTKYSHGATKQNRIEDRWKTNLN